LYEPNNAGLYDMHGNVNEWCLDLYDAYGGNATDPHGAQSGTNTYRVVRGGSWCFDAAACRSAARRYYSQDYTQDDYGFRLCLPASP
jgi:formylglycine-generating enzyme required for sulfatase activity